MSTEGLSCQEGKDQQERIKSLFEYIYIFEGDTNAFMSRYMPSAAPPLPTLSKTVTSKAFATWKPKFNHDRRSMPDLVRICTSFLLMRVDRCADLRPQ